MSAGNGYRKVIAAVLSLVTLLVLLFVTLRAVLLGEGLTAEARLLVGVVAVLLCFGLAQIFGESPLPQLWALLRGGNGRRTPPGSPGGGRDGAS